MSPQATPQDRAQAIYALAYETWTKQLGDVLKAITTNSTLRAALADGAKTPTERIDLLESATAGGLDVKVRKFLGSLLVDGEFDQLPLILTEFERLVQRKIERPVALIKSAVVLDEDQTRALRTRLVSQYGPDLDFEFEVDPSLLGGVVVRVGDRVIDGSVAGKLAALRDHLTR